MFCGPFPSNILMQPHSFMKERLFEACNGLQWPPPRQYWYCSTSVHFHFKVARFVKIKQNRGLLRDPEQTSDSATLKKTFKRISQYGNDHICFVLLRLGGGCIWSCQATRTTRSVLLARPATNICRLKSANVQNCFERREDENVTSVSD